MNWNSAEPWAKRGRAAAALLRDRGAEDGRPVAVISTSPAVVCILSAAAAALGFPLLPLDPALPDAVVMQLLAQAGAGLVVGDRDPGGYRHVHAADMLSLDPSDAPPPSRLRPDDIALMIATSGSSGRPRVVMLTADNLRAAAQASATRTPLRAGDRWLACLPLFHIGGYSILTRCALAGATAVLWQGFEATPIRDALRSASITHLSLVPVMLARLLDVSDDPPPPALRHVLVGGAALPADLAERASKRGWPLQPTYGMSETASQVATLERLPRPWRPGLVGPPLPGIELAHTPDGRLKVRGPMVMAGYAHPSLRRGDGWEDGWFVTHDLVELTERGELVILGRADEVIISGGKKVHPAWVEDALARCPGVTAVGVVGRPDAEWGEIVTAVYSGSADPYAVLGWCREHVPSAWRPRVALRVEALPCLASGKPDREALRELVRRAATSGAW